MYVSQIIYTGLNIFTVKPDVERLTPPIIIFRLQHLLAAVQINIKSI